MAGTAVLAGTALIGGGASPAAAQSTPPPTTTTAAPTPAPAPPAPAPAAPLEPGTSAPVVTLEVVPPGAPIDSGGKPLTTGSKGPAVAALENRLDLLRFEVGKKDGVYDYLLSQAVMSFQKQQGLPRTGKADPATLVRIAASDLGAPMQPGGESTRIEVDLKRQVLQSWKDGKLLMVIGVSTGSGAHYCLSAAKGGGCDTAITPGGSYRVDRKIDGVRVSKLGELLNPVYFNGGIAIHGSGSVPGEPASHGCVRIPNPLSKIFADTVAIGTPVYVMGGKVSPAPFSEQAPEEAGEVTAPAEAADDSAPAVAAPATTPTTPTTAAPAPTATTTAKAPATTKATTTTVSKPTTTATTKKSTATTATTTG